MLFHIFVFHSGCSTFWSQLDDYATLKVEGRDEYSWSLTNIPDGDHIINGNQPCTDILKDKPIEEQYLRYSKYRFQSLYSPIAQIRHFEESLDLKII